MRFLKSIFLSIFLLLCLYGFAQKEISDTTHHPLNEIEVTANRIDHFSSGIKSKSIDSTSMNQYQSTNLADLLENESPLFIKSYGLGSLATSSFRGGSATHTAVLWNGFNLNSPMNGQLDLSLIPNGFVNKVNIQYGGTSALWGSGAVGGTIHLGNEVKFNQGISVTAGSSFGSFANYQENIQVEVSKEKWISSIKLFNHTAKNDFPFYNALLFESPRQIQTNAELKQHGLLAENYFRINDKQKINIRFWYQYTDRNIPPIMLQTANKTNQKDNTYRITSEWQKTEEKTTYLTRVAWFDENLIYSDYGYDYQSLNHSQTLIAEAEVKIKMQKKHLLNAGLNNTFSRAISDGYPYKPSQNRIAAFASYSFNSTNDKFHSTLSARQEIMGNRLIPFIYSLGSDYTVRKWLSAKASVSKVYRVPTFNDLYWIPVGNPDLLPESGFTEEAGLLIKLSSVCKKINFSFEPTVFNRNMNNWILWLPGQSYWSPQNIMKVWSRGMETHSELKVKKDKLLFKINVISNYVVSTNEIPKTENDASVGKQLIYVPIYSGHGKLSIAYKKLTLSYTQNYTGYRYTSTDNVEYLEPYTLVNIYGSYKIKFSKYVLNVFVRANNIFNKRYQVLLNRAMPLINYQAGISIQFNKPNNNN